MPVCFRRSRRGALIALVLFVFAVHDLLYRLDSRAPEPPAAAANIPLGRVFIASNHWNSAKILKSHWSNSVLELIAKIGPENVYFSLYESGSWDDTKGELRQLDSRLEELGVARTIIMDETTHSDEISKPPEDEWWIETKSGKKELRRIPYLARLRNIVLEPLLSPEVANATHSFDRILFLNDVIFTVNSAKGPLKNVNQKVLLLIGGKSSVLIVSNFSQMMPSN